MLSSIAPAASCLSRAVRTSWKTLFHWPTAISFAPKPLRTGSILYCSGQAGLIRFLSG
jgi:hypothetical protein